MFIDQHLNTLHSVRSAMFGQSQSYKHIAPAEHSTRFTCSLLREHSTRFASERQIPRER